MRNEQPRDDVATMLRDGATYRVIKQTLGVSSHVITATRKAYKIPVPTSGSGYRPTPERKAVIEQQVSDLLRQAATYQVIRDEVGVSAPTIIRIRRRFGIPKPVRQYGQRPRTVAQTLALYAEPYGGGHVRWTGPHAGRMPTLSAQGRNYNARRVSFRAHHGRDPVGYVVTECTESGCMAGPHLSDATIRDRTDQTYKAIFTSGSAGSVGESS